MKPVASPCIQICRLNDNNLCAGCGRHVDEIRDWGQMTDREREQVLYEVKQRQITGLERQISTTKSSKL